ncbi:hypothetical protein BN970_03037 [Mycolicibacterium conceptionense]|uniref:Transmembrane protein n=1 Tax=Mycolicibacterium conceptionense TaxID=451644 RepID=A0A0U1DEX1_9MYCO|nr:hypothetical protein BN970_03037 [Mycolicibacterium conceptionense]
MDRQGLAVAGVTVTLTGVVLLLVLAAQAGVLRPEVRVAAGAVLAAGLVAAGWWLYRRPGGRVGAIALAATGVAAAYMDVIAVTTIYGWVSAPAGLTLAVAIGGGGLMLARRWNSEQLGLLVLVPLVVLAPVVTAGVTLLLIGFMLVLSAATLPLQFGRDWLWLYAARVAAPTLPLLIALAAASIDGRHDLILAMTCGLAAVVALAGGVVVLRWTTKPPATAILTAGGVLPVLAVGAAVGSCDRTLLVAALAAAPGRRDRRARRTGAPATSPAAWWRSAPVAPVRAHADPRPASTALPPSASRCRDWRRTGRSTVRGKSATPAAPTSTLQ